MTATPPEPRRRVAVLVDSSACLPPEAAAAQAITVVPLIVAWGDEVLRDGVDLDPHAFWQRLVIEPELPTTSAMSPAAWLKALDGVRSWADSAVCVTLPPALSAAHTAAEIAARDVGAGYRVTVLDGGAAAMALGFPVLLGARAAAGGASHDAVAGRITAASRGSRLVALLDSLEYVARSGRVPAIAARVADALPSRVVLSLQRGRIRVRARLGSRARAIDAMVRETARLRDGAAYLGVAVHHGSNAEEGAALAERIRREVAPDDCYVTSFTPVMGVHTGPGLLGIATCALPAGEEE